MSTIPSEQVTVQMGGGPPGPPGPPGPVGPGGGSIIPVASVGATNVALTGIQTLDGVAGVTGQRVLLTGQTAQSQNGVWTQQIGAWTRSSDFATGTSPSSYIIQVLSGGNVYGRSSWVLTSTGVTIDTTAQVWQIITVPRVAFSATMVGVHPAIPPNTESLVHVDTVDYDTAGGWNGTTFLYTIPMSGYYLLHGQVRFINNGVAADMAVGFYVNASSGLPNYVGAHMSGAGGHHSRMTFRNAGDTVGLHIVQATPVSCSYDTNPRGTYFQVRLVSL